MFAMFSRILKLSGRYKGRIQGAFVCAFWNPFVKNVNRSCLCSFKPLCS